VRVRIWFVVAGGLNDQASGHPQMNGQPPAGRQLEDHVLAAPADRRDRLALECLLEGLTGLGDRDLRHRNANGGHRFTGHRIGQTARDGLNFGKLGHLSLKHVSR
jgi:hypothetical protein